MADIVFSICAIVCIVSAITIVTEKNPVYSVVYMLPFFLGMTVIFALLQATFLAAIQMIVYGGAILVVFLFVIMLINLQPDELRDDFSWKSYGMAAVLVAALAGAIFNFVKAGVSEHLEAAFSRTPTNPGFGSIENLSFPLFRQHMVPFELASILIMVAILGAVLLSKKRV